MAGSLEEKVPLITYIQISKLSGDGVRSPNTSTRAPTTESRAQTQCCHHDGRYSSPTTRYSRQKYRCFQCPPYRSGYYSQVPRGSGPSWTHTSPICPLCKLQSLHPYTDPDSFLCLQHSVGRDCIGRLFHLVAVRESQRRLCVRSDVYAYSPPKAPPRSEELRERKYGGT